MIATPSPLPKQSPTPSGTSPKRTPEIVTIPEKFYGMALKMKGMTVAEMDELRKQPTPPPAPVTPPPPPVIASPIPHRTGTTTILILGFIIFFMLIAGGFVYINRDRLFSKPVVTPAPALVLPPQPPQGVAASIISTSVALSWADQSPNETGFRVERKEGDGTYILLTNLPQNSTAFTDVSASQGRTYHYRVFAINTGGESVASNEVAVSVPMSAPIAPPAPTLPPGGLDADSDGLTDAEELIFSADPKNPDTDGDGFLDGNEVFNLYNPSGKAPVRIVDSGLVTSTVSTSGWSLIIPTAWKVIHEEGRSVIETGTGETFRVHIGCGIACEDIDPNNPNPHKDDRGLKTKTGLGGRATPDGKYASFEWGNASAWTISYDMGTQPFMNYRTTFEMMLNSLTLTGAPVVAVSASVGTPGSLLGTPATSTQAMTTSTDVVPEAPTGLIVSSTVPAVSATTTSLATSTTP